jgi:nucleotide-binding universal stress UspA family protein
MPSAFANLMIPVDRSPTAQRGVDAAIQLARGGGRLHFCSVVDAADPQPHRAARTGDARALCDAAIALARTCGVRADGRVLYGPVIPAIRSYALEQGSSAIVIGSTARTRGNGRRLSRVAAGLVQRCEVPVVIAHADDVAFDEGPIAVVLDGSAPSQAALRAAVDVVRVHGRRLAIISVVDGTRVQWSDASRWLRDAAALAHSLEVAFELTTLRGPSVDTLVTAARRLRSPLMIVGMRDRGVVERAHVPVMVVRAAAPDGTRVPTRRQRRG